jgi:hypothetical protein
VGGQETWVTGLGVGMSESLVAGPGPVKRAG